MDDVLCEANTPALLSCRSVTQAFLIELRLCLRSGLPDMPLGLVVVLDAGKHGLHAPTLE